MNRFDIEIEKLLKKEGGYVNDPNDSGGETYAGISRRYNPQWSGWSVIDKLKKTNTIKELNKILKNNENITRSVKEYYRQWYWEPLRIDEIRNDDAAHELFDTGVNMGVGAAIRIAQMMLGMTVNGKMSNELIYNINHENK